MNFSTKGKGSGLAFMHLTENAQTQDLTPRHSPPPISNGRLGMMLLLGSLSVLFSCFISTYMVLRMASAAWPPAGTPPLTLGLSSFNTALLVWSSVILALSCHSVESRPPHKLAGGPFGCLAGRNPGALTSRRWTPASAGVTASLALGILFVFLQGVEFQRLYERGLTLQTGSYGAVFYTLISFHALHVIGGLIGFGMALAQPARTDYARMYWYFVTAVWLVLFSILYIL